MKDTILSSKVSSFAEGIAKRLLNLGAIQFNTEKPFTWVSGIKSPVYCDNRKISSDIKVRAYVVDAFVNVIKKEFPSVEIIAGVATGGIPMGILIADRMNLPFIYVRQAPKGHGLMRQVEGAYNAGDKLVLIEDHISTGGSSLNAIIGLRNEELDMLSLLSIMTYGFKKAEFLFHDNDVNHMSLCDLDTIVKVAESEGKITQQEKESILEFKANPDNRLVS